MKSGTIFAFTEGFRFPSWKYFYLVEAETLAKSVLVYDKDDLPKVEKDESETSVALVGQLVIQESESKEKVIPGAKISPDILLEYGVSFLGDEETAVALLQYGGFIVHK
jgi:hypothetical protein